MGIAKVRLPSLPATLYIEADKSILLQDHQKTLVLNSSLATVILLSSEDNAFITENIQQLASQLSMPVETLEQEYRKLKQLLSSEEEQKSYLDGRYPELDVALENTLITPSQFSCFVSVAETCFIIDTNNEMLSGAIKNLLKPIMCKEQAANFFISIIDLDGTYQIQSNGLVVTTGLTFEEVMPELVDRLQIVSYQSTPYLFCFHGAAIYKEGSIYLLPGESGKGKSTLCAEIQDSASTTFSDEFIVFDDEFQLIRVNLPLAIKSGSWLHLSSKYPDLIGEQEWRRLDGRKVKYIWPVNYENNPPISANKINIVFPQYQGDLQDTSATLERLSVIETIELLTNGGYQVSDELNELKLEMLLFIIEKSERITLTYSSTHQALRALGISDA